MSFDDRFRNFKKQQYSVSRHNTEEIHLKAHYHKTLSFFVANKTGVCYHIQIYCRINNAKARKILDLFEKWGLIERASVEVDTIIPSHKKFVHYKLTDKGHLCYRIFEQLNEYFQ